MSRCAVTFKGTVHPQNFKIQMYPLTLDCFRCELLRFGGIRCRGICLVLDIKELGGIHLKKNSTVMSFSTSRDPLTW